MTDQTPKVNVRKLRTVTETMRERADKSTAKIARTDNKPKRFTGRIRSTSSRIAQLPIWRPFKFIGRYIIPPYFRASWRELRQVTWPNRKQTRQLTGAVIMFSAVFGIIVAAFDYGLDKLFKQVIIK